MLLPRSFWVSPFCVFYFLSSCCRPLDHLSLHGVPIKPITKNFVIQLKDSVRNATDTDQIFRQKTQILAQDVGCHVDYDDALITDSRLVRLVFKDCAIDGVRLERVLEALSKDALIVDLD